MPPPKSMKQKRNTGSSIRKTKKNSALSKLKLLPLPDSIPDYPAFLMKRGKHFEEVREIYSQLGTCLSVYGHLHQSIDCNLMVQAAINLKLSRDFAAQIIDPKNRVTTEAKSHVNKGQIEGIITKPNVLIRMMRDAEDAYRHAINALGLTPTKRAMMVAAMSTVNSVHDTQSAADPFAQFFVAAAVQQELA